METELHVHVHSGGNVVGVWYNDQLVGMVSGLGDRAGIRFVSKYITGPDSIAMLHSTDYPPGVFEIELTKLRHEETKGDPHTQN